MDGRPSARRRRVGILLGSTDCNPWIYETVRALAAADNMELWFLVNDRPPPRRPTTLARACFRVLAFAESALMRLCRAKTAAVRSRAKSVLAFSERVLSLSPEFSPSGLSVRYPAKDIEQIREMGFDLLVSGIAECIFRGNILHAAKDGILSWHYSDNRRIRGGPLGFWEVYHRRPSSGFVLQVLTEERDGGSVVFRGNVATQRYHTANADSLRNQSNLFLAKIVRDYADSGRLPRPEESVPYSGALYSTPSVGQSARYALRVAATLPAVARARFRPKSHMRKGAWQVAFVERPWRVAALRHGTRIQNPPGAYLADPFVVARDGRTVVFVEQLVYARKRGHIAAVELLGASEYRMLGPVVAEPFHMSFPHVFEYEGRLYMTPETSEANACRLYECTEFPLEWTYRGILCERPLVDPMVFEHEGLWWLWGTDSVGGGEATSLLAFWADDPLSGTWSPHQRNPLVIDSQTARNGGILFDARGDPVRVRQAYGFGASAAYGERCSLARITKLTPRDFKEQQIAEIAPEFFPGIRGCHHMSGNDRWTTYDFRR